MNIDTYDKFLEKMQEIAYIKKPIEIRFDIKSSEHVWRESKWRHGFDNRITNVEMIEMIEKSIETLTIDIMQNNLNVGERFILKKGDLHIVCILNPGEDFFTIIIITVMRKDDFRIAKGQYVLDVNKQESHKFNT